MTVRNIHNYFVRYIEYDDAELEAYFMDNSISRDKKAILYFAPNGSNIVDKVYFEKHGIPYDLPINIGNTLQRKKIGRNDPCPCGSGKKYKKCCIGKGIYD